MNIVKNTLSEESLSLLRAIKNKTMIGYRALGENDREYALCQYILDFDDQTSIAITCDEVESRYYSIVEDNNCFACEEFAGDLKKQNYYSWKVKPLHINNIEIVTDKISEKWHERDGDSETFVDVAIILHSNERFITLSLDCMNFGYGINLTENKKIDELRPIEEVEKAWGDGAHGASEKVSRSSREL